MNGVELFSQYRRVSDNKWYDVGDEVSLDGVVIGTLGSIGEFKDGVRVHVTLYEDKKTEHYGEFYSLGELD